MVHTVTEVGHSTQDAAAKLLEWLTDGSCTVKGTCWMEEGIIKLHYKHKSPLASLVFCRLHFCPILLAVCSQGTDRPLARVKIEQMMEGEHERDNVREMRDNVREMRETTYESIRETT